MKFKRIISSAFFFGALACGAYAQQPYGGCWHPDYIKTWAPEKDVDAKFNRSTTPLQPRFQDLTVKANPYQFYDGKVSACLTMNPMCSQTPSQGTNNFIGYNPTYWQYMDVLVWWGGAAGEGIIIPPSAPVTDAAHMNGVKVLGQLFFPPSAFGGQTKWVVQMLTKEGDAYPYAKKMYEIAKYYGFDGWFINEETGGGSQAQWEEFIAYFQKCAKEDNNSDMEIQWYDCGTSASGVSNLLKVSGTSYFANYGSANSNTISNNMQAVQALGFSKEQAFSKIYHGIECAQGGIAGNGGSFQSCFPKTGHAGSIDLFNPEEGIWKKIVADYLGTSKACGEDAYKAMDQVFKNESRFWTNKANDPSNVTCRDKDADSGSEGIWPGFANAIMERSTIQNKPFISAFSAGLGKARFVNGEKKGTQDWYHRGMQSIMPTWRWWIESSVKGELAVSMNWDDAYNIGTSLVVKGKLSANVDHLTRLYKTKLSIESGDKFELVYKTATPNSLEAKFGVSENNNDFTTFPIVETSTSNGWTVATVDLSSLAGKTVSVIALNFKSSTEVADYEAKLGQISIMNNSAITSAVPAISNLSTQSVLKEEVSDIRVIWDAPKNASISHYNVYLERNGVKQLVGQTRNEGFYISKFARTSDAEKTLKVSVASVGMNMKESEEKTLEMSFPQVTVSVVSLKAEKTLVKVGEEVKVFARATNKPTSFEWAIPANAELVKQEGNSATFKFSKAGTYSVAVKVSNSAGATDSSIQNYIEVSDSKELINVGLKKAIAAVSSNIDKHNPLFLLDGLRAPSSMDPKWCTGGSKSHWVVVDLKETYKLYSFKIFDCGMLENASDNIKNYKIELSNDNQNWTLALDESNRPETEKTDYIKPTEARYVRFTPYDNEMPITIRIYEFEIYGTEGNLQLEKSANKVLNVNSTTPIELSYSLGGDAKEENFSCTAVSSNPDVLSVKNLTLTDAKVKFDMVAKQNRGKATVTVLLKNGKWTKQTVYEVILKDLSVPNVVANIKPVVVTANQTDEANKVSNSTGPIGEVGVTDGVEGTWWSSGYYSDSTPHSLTFALNDMYEISYFRTLFNAHNYLKLPKKIKILASTTTDESASYVEVASQAITNADTEFNATIPFKAKYLKVEVTPVSNYGFSFAEFEAYGKKADKQGTGINTIEDIAALNVTPNPVHNGEILNIKATDATKAQLISLQGSILNEVLVSNGVAHMPVYGIASGTYIVRTIGDNGMHTQKVVVK